MKAKLIFSIIVVLFSIRNTKGGLANSASTVAPNPLNFDFTGQATVAKQLQIENEYAQEKARQDFVPQNPWRAVNGITNYVKNLGVEFCGKVVDVTKDGIRVEGEFGKLFYTSYLPGTYEYHDFFVANYPFEVVNDHIISSSEHNMAFYVGTYTYSTVNGSSRTIQKLDYGVPCGVPLELIKQQVEQSKVAKEKAEQAKLAAAEKALKYNQEQADKGDPTGLLRMAERYRDGEGVEKDLTKAKDFFQKAIDAGSPSAADELKRLDNAVAK
jgi:TPR repeat protein